MPASHHSFVLSWTEQYCRSERNPLLDLFVVSEPMDFASALKSKEAQGFGCYAIYDAEGRLRYIGMSQIGMAPRLQGHIKAAESPFWLCAPASKVALIKVFKNWEPPSLEAYLTCKTAALRAETWPQTPPADHHSLPL